MGEVGGGETGGWNTQLQSQSVSQTQLEEEDEKTGASRQDCEVTSCHTVRLPSTGTSLGTWAQLDSQQSWS